MANDLNSIDAETLRHLYEDMLMSTRKIAVLFGLSPASAQRVAALLRKHGIEIRHGSAAVATQWAGNDSRRLAQAESMRAMATERASRGLHWAKGRTKETDPRLMSISEKLISSGRLARRDVIDRATVARKARTYIDPSRHRQASVSPTMAEASVRDMIEDAGCRFVFQHPVRYRGNLHFVDFVILCDNGDVAVEVVRCADRAPPERLWMLSALGYRPMVIPNWAALKKSPRVVECISMAKAGEWNPTTGSECWVRTGRGGGVPVRQADYDKPLGGNA